MPNSQLIQIQLLGQALGSSNSVNNVQLIYKPLCLLTFLPLLNGEKNPNDNPTHCQMYLTCSFTY